MLLDFIGDLTDEGVEFSVRRIREVGKDWTTKINVNRAKDGDPIYRFNNLNGIEFKPKDEKYILIYDHTDKILKSFTID